MTEHNPQTYTTLKAIREHKPSESSWSKLLSFLGKTKSDDAPLALVTVLESNGIEDAIWCLRALNGKDREVRLFAVECVEQVKHLLTDQRSLNVLEVAKRYANAEATEEELRIALAAARSAAHTVARAEADAALAAARSAEVDAASAASRSAAAVVWAKVWAVESLASSIPKSEKEEAEAEAAEIAAGEAAKKKQTEIFLKYFGDSVST